MGRVVWGSVCMRAWGLRLVGGEGAGQVAGAGGGGALLSSQADGSHRRGAWLTACWSPKAGRAPMREARAVLWVSPLPGWPRPALQSCYGVPELPDQGDMWLCRACELKEEGKPAPQCCLCPVAGGALKPTTVPGLWCHAACLQWIPEVGAPGGRAREQWRCGAAAGCVCAKIVKLESSCVGCRLRACQARYPLFCPHSHPDFPSRSRWRMRGCALARLPSLSSAPDPSLSFTPSR